MEYVHSILWRNFNKATIDTLTGKSDGQYDIRLGAKSSFTDFFEGLPRMNNTKLGGFDVNITLEKVEDYQSNLICDKHLLTIRFMGDNSSRKDWNIPSQRPNTAYPMWIQEGRFPKKIDVDSYIILVRTTTGKFYGRILLSNELACLPDQVSKAMSQEKESGVCKLQAVIASREAENVYYKLLKYKNLLLYGPPGTGKTTIIKEVVNIFNNGGVSPVMFDEKKTKDYFENTKLFGNSKSMWTTFHQSYSYEEFVIGMSTKNSSSKLLEIVPKQGKLLEAAEYAREADHRTLLIIDELNRANVSKVFGEFITLMEPGKRLDEAGKITSSTVGIELPYLNPGEKLTFLKDGQDYSVCNPYYMPYNLYTLASMNSVDKSIFPLDGALRRRFARYELYPNVDLLAEHLGVAALKLEESRNKEDHNFSEKTVYIIACGFLKYLNSKINIFLGRDYSLGHSYFWDLDSVSNYENATEYFKEIFFEQIFPQLEELFRGKEEQLMYILNLAPNDTEGPFIIIDATDEDIEEGATSVFIQNTKITNLKMIEWAKSFISIGGDE